MTMYNAEKRLCCLPYNTHVHGNYVIHILYQQHHTRSAPSLLCRRRQNPRGAALPTLRL